MKRDITLTVIIPVYNTEAYLRDCLDSVISQTVPFDDVIIINDGSTDKSRDICDYYAKSASYIRLVDTENHGLGAARNTGIEMATGDYMLFLDSDDMLDARTVEKLTHSLKKHAEDILYFDASAFSDSAEDGERLKWYERKGEVSTESMKGAEWLEMVYPHSFFISACMAVYRRDYIIENAIRFPEGLYYEDNYFTIRMLCSADCVRYLPGKLYQRRFRPGSIMTGHLTQKKVVDHFLVFREVLAYIGQLSPSVSYLSLFVFYVCDNMLILIRKWDDYEKYEGAVSDEAKAIIISVIEDYKEVIALLSPDYIGMSPDSLLLTAHIYDGLLRILSKDVSFGLDDYIRDYNLIGGKLKEWYKNELKNIFGREYGKRTAVYGCGKHSEGALYLYRMLFGKDPGEVVFIETEKSRESFFGYPVINVTDIDVGTASVFISSYIYRKEMHARIHGISDLIHVIDLYDSCRTDMFSDYERIGDLIGV